MRIATAVGGTPVQIFSLSGVDAEVVLWPAS